MASDNDGLPSTATGADDYNDSKDKSSDPGSETLDEVEDAICTEGEKKWKRPMAGNRAKGTMKNTKKKKASNATSLGSTHAWSVSCGSNELLLLVKAFMNVSCNAKVAYQQEDR
jgi:hypothetical protein